MCVDTPSTATSTATSTPPPPQRPAGKLGLPLVIDELLPAVIHCLYDKRWGARVAGVRCIGLLLEELPAELLWHSSPSIVHGLLLVAAALPAHSNAEKRRVQELLVALLEALYPATDAPPVADDKAGKDKGDAEPAMVRIAWKVKALSSAVDVVWCCMHSTAQSVYVCVLKHTLC